MGELEQKDSKYYTPSIEEFYVGFEFEIYEPMPYYKNNKMPYVWKSQVFNENTFNTEIETRDGEMPFEAGIEEKTIRVKYLSKEDIESLGFTDIENLIYEDMHRKGQVYGFKFTIKDEVYGYYYIAEHVLDIHNNKMWDEHFDYVCGITIKNKSELKVLLKQLGINE